MRPFLPLLGILLLAPPGRAAAPDPQELADRIDERLDARLKAAGVPAAPAADDAEFLRRASLDITGRIPAVREVHDFLADPSPGKRGRLIDDLLETPRHAAHAAAVWRAALAPETTAVPEARPFRAGFEAWLRLRLRQNAPYDDIARDLIAAPLSGDADSPTPALRRPEEANPLAFYAVKEAKPENLAAAVSRVFLGVQIECAQCHDHPFARWTRDQFWNQAAFFAGLERSGDGLFAPISEKAAGDIRVGDTKRRVPPRFLDGKAPGPHPRDELAAWVTARDNPFFARTAANRVWGQFFGRGLVDPVDDFHESNPPSHPELLDDLAEAFAESGYDLRYLARAIGRTKAYRRTSARTDPGQDDPKLFARMAVKGLTGEQLFDSLSRATGLRDKDGRDPARDRFLAGFAQGGRPAEPQTSIPQALALMNGKFVAAATTLESSPALIAAYELPGLTDAERVEVLYLSALGRKPRAKEVARLTKLAGGREALEDLFWALLNSAEFRLNH